MNDTSSTKYRHFSKDNYPNNTVPPRHNRRRLGSVLAMSFAAITAGIAITSSIDATTKPTPETNWLTVRTAELKPVHRYTLHRTFLGRVEAARNSDLGFELAGKIDRILVDEGDQVVKGQVLAHLDIDLLKARRRELVSALEQTGADFKLADITYRRYKKVVKSSGVSKHQLDEAKEHQNAAEAAVKLARSRIKTIDVEIDKSTLTAPFDADVTLRSADEGRVIAAGSPILRLQENTASEIRVGIAGKVVDSIQVGSVIPVTINRSSFQASVKTIVPVTDGRTRTVDVILNLNKLPPKTRPGDLVKAEVSMNIDREGYWIPISALSEDIRGLWSIYTLKQTTGKEAGIYAAVHRRTIEIIHAESDRVFVEGFFDHDDRLITDGLQRIVPGQLVRLY